MLTVIVITQNEEDRIEACLESVKWADEIIVHDSGSVDKTLEIARKYTDHIIQHKGGNFSEWRNRANEKAHGDWVFYIDADERVLAPLKDEVLAVTSSENPKAAYAISRTNIIFGQEVHYGPYKNDRMIRLFKKDKFKGWVGDVHEHGNFDGELGYLKNPVLHLTHRDLDHFMNKALAWSNFDAKLRFYAKHPPMTKWRFMRILLSEFYEQGVRRRGFFGGTVGMIDSMLQVFFFYMTYVRLWQMQQRVPLSEKYNQIDKKLIEDGFKY